MTNYNVNGALNLPIVDGTLAARVVGWYINDSGFIDQTRVAAGRLNNVNTDETAGGRGELRWTPTADLSITASATYQKQHSDGSSRYTPAGRLSFSAPGYPAVPGGDLINTDLSRSPYDDKTQIYSLTGEYAFSAGSIVATTNYFKRDILFNFDSSPILFFFGVPIPGITIQPQARRIWSNELRYASKFNGPLNFVVGGFYSNEKADFDVQVLKINQFGNAAGPFSRLNSDDALSTANGNTFFGRFDNNKLNQAAFFGEATFEITPTLKRRSLLVILSDCFDQLEPLRTALNQFRHQKHEIILFHIIAPEEREFPFGKPTQFRSLERSNHRILSDPHRLRQHYLAQFEEFCKSLKHHLGSVGADYCQLVTTEPYQTAFGAYLNARATRKSR